MIYSESWSFVLRTLGVMSVALNIWKLNGERFLSSLWLMAPILVPYYQANGLDAAEVYLIQALFAVAMLCLEVPSGYIADVMGYKRTLFIAAFFMPLGLVTYALSDSFVGFVFAEFLLAIGLSLRSGTNAAYLYATLREDGKEKSYQKAEGTAFMFESAGYSLGNIFGGLAALISLRFTFWLNAATSFFLVPLCATMKPVDQGNHKAKSFRLHVRDFVRAVKFCGRQKVTRYASLYLALSTGLNLMGYWSFYLYYSEVGLPLVWFGFVTALSSIGAGFGGKIMPFVEKKWGGTVALAVPLLAAPSFFLTGWINSLWGLPLIFFNTFLWGYSIPLLRNTINEHARHHIRATILSVEGMGERITYIAVAATLGFIIETTSVQTGLMILGPLFLVVCFWPAYKLAKIIRG